MIDEENLEKKQKGISEIIKNYINPDLLTKNWNKDGLLVIISFII
jgi:hypothetical protein